MRYEFQHFFYVSGNLHASPFFHYSALSVNNKRTALDTAYRLAIHLFHLHDVEQQANGFVRIGNQFERQLQLGFEILVRAQGIAADAIDFRAGGDKLRIRVAEGHILSRATWGVVLWIEKQHRGLGWATQQLKGFAAGHGGTKVW